MSAAYQYGPFDHLRVELPGHWEEKALKFISLPHSQAFVDGPFGSDLKSDEYVEEGTPLIQLNNIRDGHHVLRNMKFITSGKKASLSRHIARPGDLVFAKMAEPVARTALVSAAFQEYVIVADCVKMSADERLVDTGFLVWAINSDCVRVTAELVSTGTTRIRISLGELKRLRVPFPPIEEQTQIAKFLDYETAKIDALIEKQQQLIALLKEKRQVVISHAVTKGLNPDAPMRDSGVEWLGEVPAHWTTCALGKLTLDKCDGPFGSGLKSEHYTEAGVRVVRLQNIRMNRYWGGSDAFIDPEHYERNLSDHSVVSEDVLIAGLGDPNNPVGRACVAPQGIEPAMVKADCFRFRLDRKKLNPEFAALQLSASARFASGKMSNGSTRARIPLSFMSKRQIAYCPLKEQQAIVSQVRYSDAKFEKLEETAAETVELLKERRTALISAAVTGKIDVRDWKAPTQPNAEAEVA